MNETSLPKPHVVVIGGGLAGMASACQLLDDGYQVTLVEKRPFLGGRTFSFDYPLSPKDDESEPEGRIQAESTRSQVVTPNLEREVYQVDNGQHVYLGCCTYYIDFLKKLGSLSRTHMQQKFHVEVRRPGNDGRPAKIGSLSAAPLLPAPFHLFPSFLKFTHLGVRDKLRVIYGLFWVTFAKLDSQELENQSFYDWLKKHGQTEQAIDNFWNLMILATLNDDSRAVSAAMALMVYQEGVLKGRNTANIGYSNVGLSELVSDPVRDRVLAMGGGLRTGKLVSGLILEAGNGASGKRIAGVELADGEVVRGDAYISAVSFSDLATILPNELSDQPFFTGTKGLAIGPIVNVDIWYDRRVMDAGDDPFVALLDSPLQWVFDKGRILGAGDVEDFGQYLCISISGAWEYVGVSKDSIEKAIVQAMKTAFPQAKDARVREILVIKSQATFRCTPGSARLRPPAQTPVDNLYLAGDWTATGWPSTMEGAVRSGLAAAEAVASRIK